MSARKLPPTEAANRRDHAPRRRLGPVTVSVVLGTVILLVAFIGVLPDRGDLADPPKSAPPGSHQHRRQSRPDRSRRRVHNVAIPAAQAQYTIRAGARSTRVPTSFFGLSTEYWTIPIYELHPGLFDRALSLMRVRGGGPQVLRIGGDSADHTFWDPRRRRMPAWVFELTPRWLGQVSDIVRRDRLRLIIDLNLVTDSPQTAVQVARAAEQHLPRRRIIGFEVGNEPDLFSHSFWLASIGKPSEGVLPQTLTAAIYQRDFDSYASRLAKIAPRVPLIGPALSNPTRNLQWLTTLIGGSHPGLRTVSVHRYPYSACVTSRSAVYPTVQRLLSEYASTGLARSVRRAAVLAHRAGLSFRVTELNSVTCGGLSGVSNAFATALWAPDTLFEMLEARVDGVNIHLRANPVNAPFTLSRRGFYARPLLYGLAMFARTLGPDALLLHAHLHAARSLHLKVWAVRLRGGMLHVLLIDKGAHAVRVALRVPARGLATVQRLLAPSAAATAHVTLAGQRIGRSGRWLGRLLADVVTRRAHGIYYVTVPRYSAALVAIRRGI